MLLSATRLEGDEAALLLAIERFWADVKAALSRSTSRRRARSAASRPDVWIRFFDTDAHALHADNAYIVREREDMLTGEREVTLKFRHPDRYVASDRSMAAIAASDVKTKFEEDVKPPFVSVFSFSTTQPLESEAVCSVRVQDVAMLFPGLPEAVETLPHDRPLVLVGDFVGVRSCSKGRRCCSASATSRPSARSWSGTTRARTTRRQ